MYYISLRVVSAKASFLCLILSFNRSASRRAAAILSEMSSWACMLNRCLLGVYFRKNWSILEIFLLVFGVCVWNKMNVCFFYLKNGPEKKSSKEKENKKRKNLFFIYRSCTRYQYKFHLKDRFFIIVSL